MTREALPPPGSNSPEGSLPLQPSLDVPSNGIEHNRALEPLQKDVILGDDGNPLAIKLTPEQAKAGKEALEALFLLPDIHPHTPVAEAIVVLNEQMPIIDEKAKALEDARKRRRARVNQGLSLVTAGSLAFGGFQFYDVNLSPASWARYDTSHMLTVEPSATSWGNWRIRYPNWDPNIRFEEKEPQRKPQVVKQKENVIVDNRDTKIIVDQRVLADRRVVPSLKITKSTEVGDLKEVFLQPDSVDGVDTSVVVFENVADAEESYFTIRRRETNPPTFEFRAMKKAPLSGSANR